MSERDNTPGVLQPGVFIRPLAAELPALFDRHDVGLHAVAAAVEGAAGGGVDEEIGCFGVAAVVGVALAAGQDGDLFLCVIVILGGDEEAEEG